MLAKKYEIDAKQKEEKGKERIDTVASEKPRFKKKDHKKISHYDRKL